MTQQPTVAGRWPISGYYFLYFAAVGISLPFMPAYYRSLQLSGAQIGALLSINPLMALFAPPLWGHLADRTGRTDRVLRTLAAGAFLGFAPLLLLRDYGAIVATCVVYALFASAISTMADSLALARAEATGDSYSRLRLFGSVGFVVASTTFGALVSQLDVRVVLAVTVLLGAAFACSLRINAKSAVGRAGHPLAAMKLLGQRDIAVLLACTALHWIGCAPFHGSYAIHLGALGLSPSVVGFGSGLGVAAEVAVMLAYPRTFARMQPRNVLALAFAASALRWFLTAAAGEAVPLVALQLLHGLTFGAFYTASVSYLASRVPPELRASGQALYVAITFGVGGLIGYTTSGALYDAVGGHRLFVLAGLLELIPLALVRFVRPQNKAAPAAV